MSGGMMPEKKIYKCRLCGQNAEINDEKEVIPDCCGTPMEKDDSVCVVSETAEHARVASCVLGFLRPGVGPS